MNFLILNGQAFVSSMKYEYCKNIERSYNKRITCNL